MRMDSPAKLEAYRSTLQQTRDSQAVCLSVCGGTGCRAYGADEVVAAARADGRIPIRITGCPGFCEQGPIVVVQPEGIFYPHVQARDVPEIITETALSGRVIDRLAYVDPATGHRIPHERDIPFYAKQMRVLLNQNGLIDPTSIDDYVVAGGYDSLAKALTLIPEQIIAEIRTSGLRGRGGAGFPTATKWQAARAEIQKHKATAPDETSGYVICNADEGDPGAFMDRALVEGNPHRIIEGMIIGAYAIGAAHGYVYIRAEYPLAVQNLKIALGQARELGLLGPGILGTRFDFDLEIRIGAGAFVCGEETALIASIEGRTGDPRPRPPYPVQRGVWGKPTVINNVKTWATIPVIVARGAEWYASIGTADAKGTMIFSLVGKVVNTGLVEVPMGITLRDLIYGIGGGIRNGGKFKAVQIGGPSGGCLPEEHLDTPVGYASITALGAIMGSGGMVVADQDTCMVDLARYFMNFVQEESCGKCTPCRLGTKAMLDTLTRITQGLGEEGDIEYLNELAETVQAASLCGLGQTAPNPLLTTLRYFRHEYEEHVYGGICRAKVCKGLIRYEIIAELCKGCLVCLRNCSTHAITGEKLGPHVIHNELCGKCGVCKALCKFDAVRVLTGNGQSGDGKEAKRAGISASEEYRDN